MIMPQDILFAGGGYAPAKYGVSSLRRAPSSRGGEELKETFARAGTNGGYYIDRDGILRRATTDVLRPSWMYSNADLVNRVQAFSLEEQSTNICLRSQELDNATWGKNRSSVSANTDTAPDGTVTADRLIEDGTVTNTHNASQSITITANANVAYSYYVKAGTRTWIALQVADNTSTDAVTKYFNLSTGALGSTGLAGTGTLVTALTEALGSGWYRCIVVVNIGNGRTACAARLFLATGDNGATYSGDGVSYVIPWGAQVEDNVSQHSSYIPTVAATLTRSRDVISYPLYVAPNKNIAIYHRHIERDAPNFPATNNRLWQIGKADNTTPRLVNLKNNGNDSYAIVHDEGAASVQVSADTNPTFNDLIETRVIYTGATGVVQIGAAKSAGTETLSSASSGLTPGAVWSDVLLSINSIGAASAGRQGWIATIVATWSGSAPSMDDFRALLN